MDNAHETASRPAQTNRQNEVDRQNDIFEKEKAAQRDRDRALDYPPTVDYNPRVQTPANNPVGFNSGGANLLNINGKLINPNYIVTAHIEPGTTDPRMPHVQQPSTLVLMTAHAGELRFVGKDAELLWEDLAKLAG